MTEIPILAAQIASVLAPAMPYLIKGSQKAAEEACTKIGVDSWEAAKMLWAKLSPKMMESKDSKENIEKVAKKFNDNDTKLALEYQIKELLSDLNLVQELTGQVGGESIQRILADDGSKISNIILETSSNKSNQEIVAKRNSEIKNIKISG